MRQKEKKKENLKTSLLSLKKICIAVTEQTPSQRFSSGLCFISYILCSAPGLKQRTCCSSASHTMSATCLQECKHHRWAKSLLIAHKKHHPVPKSSAVLVGVLQKLGKGILKSVFWVSYRCLVLKVPRACCLSCALSFRYAGADLQFQDSQVLWF